MTETAKITQINGSAGYESVRDLRKLRFVFKSANQSLQEFADQEYEEPDALVQQDAALRDQQALLESASEVRSTNFESVLLKFELWLEDYAQSGGDLLSSESEAVLYSIHEDLLELANR